MDDENHKANAAVNAGRVHCVSRGRDASVEDCWMCSWLLGFRLDGTAEVVRCAAPLLDEPATA